MWGHQTNKATLQTLRPTYPYYRWPFLLTTVIWVLVSQPVIVHALCMGYGKVLFKVIFMSYLTKTIGDKLEERCMILQG